VSFPQEFLILEFLTTNNIVREIGRTSDGFLRLSTTIVLVTLSNCYKPNKFSSGTLARLTEHVMSGSTSNSGVLRFTSIFEGTTYSETYIRHKTQ